MPADAMVEKFGGKKRPPKFADEGPPEMEDAPRGGGAGVGDDAPDAPDDGDSEPPDSGPPDSSAPMPGDSGDQAVDPAEKSIDDMSDLLGVGPEDRADFANALKTYINSCLQDAMMPDMGGGDMPPAPGGPPPAGGPPSG